MPISIEIKKDEKTLFSGKVILNSVIEFKEKLEIEFVFEGCRFTVNIPENQGYKINIL